jgi:hypothetical protein
MLQNVKVTSPQVRQEREFEHAKLRGDVEILRSYGEEHPDEWTDLHFENEPTVRLVALVAGPHRDLHERALLKLVNYPNQLVVRETKYSRRELDEMRQTARQMSEFHNHKFLSVGTGHGQLQIQLQPDQERLAATLLDKFGDAVDLKVGAFPYPMPPESNSEVVRRPNISNSQISLITEDNVDVALLEPLEIISGRTGRGVLVFINRGRNEVVLNTNGWLTARVVDPLTGEVVGGFVGMQAMPLIRFSMPPGETVTVPVSVGTASFKRSLGYLVPPGEWMIDVTVKVNDVGDRRIPLQSITITPSS